MVLPTELHQLMQGWRADYPEPAKFSEANGWERIINEAMIIFKNANKIEPTREKVTRGYDMYDTYEKVSQV